uniref:RNA-directed RNA polymerase n=1 Tax=Ascaris lumbricoides TaxID=6252 RepID=A0A0M3IUH8_ASCLU
MRMAVSLSFPERPNDTRDNCAAINESPFMCLEFTSDLENLLPNTFFSTLESLAISFVFNDRLLNQESEFYEILCRLHARIGLPLDFSWVKSEYAANRYVAPPVRIIGSDHRRIAKADEQVEGTDHVAPIESPVDARCAGMLKECGNFGLEYFIAALISRGAIVKDQILVLKQLLLHDKKQVVVFWRYAAPPVRIIGCDHRWIAEADEQVEGTDHVASIESPVDARCAGMLKECGNFGLEYFIAALISRGAIVKDQILVLF